MTAQVLRVLRGLLVLRAPQAAQEVTPQALRDLLDLRAPRAVQEVMPQVLRDLLVLRATQAMQEMTAQAENGETEADRTARLRQAHQAYRTPRSDQNDE